MKHVLGHKQTKILWGVYIWSVAKVMWVFNCVLASYAVNYLWDVSPLNSNFVHGQIASLAEIKNKDNNICDPI